MEIGDRLASWLQAKGISQRSLASKVDVSPGAVNGWVSGAYAPSQANLEKIVEVLGVSMAEFYGPVPKPKKAAAKKTTTTKRAAA